MNATVEVTLDESQQSALDSITVWLQARLANPIHPGVFRLGGAAGTGKTTLIKETVAWCNANGHSYEVVAPSGKAASVLRGKGIDASTIHSLYYVPNREVIDEVYELQVMVRDYPTTELFQRLHALEKLQYARRPSSSYPDLIVVDEASMVDGEVSAHLQETGSAILAVGDPAQLGPVDKEGVPLFAEQTPDALLQVSHRFQDSELLTRVADATRRNEPVPVEVLADPWEVDLSDFDAVIVWRNDTRWEMIWELRTEQGKPLNEPVAGDRIMVWHNNRDLGLFNGELLTVDRVSAHPKRPSMFACEAHNDLGDKFIFDLARRGFKDQNGILEAKRYAKKDHIVASFGDVLTCHKAQGSQYDSVLVAEDHATGRDAVSWRYTACTRAAKKLVLVGGTWLHNVPGRPGSA